MKMVVKLEASYMTLLMLEGLFSLSHFCSSKFMALIGFNWVQVYVFKSFPHPSWYPISQFQLCVACFCFLL